MTTVAAVIPTIPEREDILTDALASLILQTRKVDEAHVVYDEDHRGPSWARNRGVADAGCEWLAFLDDDDVWLPHHIDALLGASGGADVVYSDCLLVGDHNGPILNCDFDPFTLEVHNYIPVTALVRRSAFLAVGGFDPDDRYEDWGLWRRLSAEGALFTHLPVVTWEYRFHGAQRTFDQR